GYDVRVYKLIVFAISGALAGLAGILFANTGFVSPNMFSLQLNAQVIIWTIVGGLGTLVGPIVGCILMQMLTTELGRVNQSGGLDWLDPNLVLGVVLVVFVVLVPRGLVPTARGWFEAAIAVARAPRRKAAQPNFRRRAALPTAAEPRPGEEAGRRHDPGPLAGARPGVLP
ncbi:MAG: hypothetical protein ACFCVH_19335, partial [Alphaproteobacteria bacterium]